MKRKTYQAVLAALSTLAVGGAYASAQHEDNNDAGSGIPTENHVAAFAPFHRLQNATGEESGLGLAIAREAGNKVGGQVTVSNRIDANGLVFMLRLPYTFKGG